MVLQADATDRRNTNGTTTTYVGHGSGTVVGQEQYMIDTTVTP
jgi:hypothetical protein